MTADEPNARTETTKGLLGSPPEGAPSEEDLRSRTEHLLLAAERVSIQLILQTERLAEAIDLFDREIIVPLREGLK